MSRSLMSGFHGLLTFYHRRSLDKRTLYGLYERELESGLGTRDTSDVVGRDAYAFDERELYASEKRDPFAFEERKASDLPKRDAQDINIDTLSARFADLSVRGPPKPAAKLVPKAPPKNESPPPPSKGSPKGSPIAPAMQEALSKCRGGKHHKRANFVMQGPPVSASFAHGGILSTGGLCGCWVVAILSSTDGIVVHIPHGQAVPVNGQLVYTVTSAQQATTQIGQLLHAYSAHPFHGAFGFILKHSAADAASTTIISNALAQAGLSVSSGTYTNNDVAYGGNLEIVGEGHGSPRITLDGQRIHWSCQRH